MKKSKDKSNFKTALCKKVLSLSLTSARNDLDECILILFEPEQPENLKKIDLMELKKKLD
jgi:cyclic lactone autoinducer peptide